ncbi:MAG: diacylglycerol kinase [Rickettsiales bacterium]|jgi:diacylglycerol kinase (ATP)|nr:diacylglycerol kinase [Rickettsiales bacterium]
MKSGHTGIKRIVAAFGYSFDGIRSVWNSESAFRQDIVLVAAGFIALYFLPVSYSDKILLGFSLPFILLAELVNTAIETIVDRIGAEYHDLSKKAKDIGSAIVFITIFAVAILWIAVLAV